MQYIKEKLAKINKQIGTNKRKIEIIKRKKALWKFYMYII